MSETLYIIDGHAQIYRAYYAPFTRSLTSPTGEPTRATYVFCSMLLKFIEQTRPRYLAMAIDGPAGDLKRRQMYPQYKITRKPVPDDFRPQAKRIIQIVAAMGIPILEAKGYEADDIMATAAERLASQGLKIVLISRDKDLDQLVTDRVGLYDPQKDKLYGPPEIEQEKGYPPVKAIEIQTLMGDSTDNIPGIPGVGPKTAVRLVMKYGSAQSAIDHADEQTPKLRENLLAGRETIDLSHSLVTLDRDVPMDLDLDSMKFAAVKGRQVRPIFAELGFNVLVDRLDQMGVDGDDTLDVAGTAEANAQKSAKDCRYVCVDSPDALARLAGTIQAQAKGYLALDTETDSILPMWASLVGISLAWRAGEAIYIPVKGPLGAKVLDVKNVRDALAPVLADESLVKVGHNLKYDLIVLANAGVEVKGPIMDTMIAAHVLDSSRMTYKLDALAAEMLNHRCIPIEEVIGRGRNQVTMDTVPIDVVYPYAAEDADVTFRLAEVLSRELRKNNLVDLMEKLEMPLLPVLVAMERRGVIVDPASLKRMELALSGRAEKMRSRIIELAGREFNPDSPKQLAVILFEDLGMDVVKSKKTGPSTDSSVLGQLAVQHELPGVVLDYRKLTKLIGTYLKALGERIHPETGRIHTSFHQAGTVTGRLSSSDPNLQNIPIRTEDGRQIRSAFVAEKGSMLLSADYSQVELRMLAHLSGDETLLAAFKAGQDIHRTVAAEVFALPIEEVTSDLRGRAKAVNFGIIYGQTAFGLSVSLRISRREAADFIARYKARFPRIEEFFAQCRAKAKADGYVETIFGRRRKIAEIDAGNPVRRARAERLAVNTSVQGSAADLIKQAMINIDARIRDENRPCSMLLQIHDELVFEIPADQVDQQKEMIVAEMENAIELTVPIKVDVGTGTNWLDAK